jgi:hypothetical protein
MLFLDHVYRIYSNSMWKSTKMEVQLSPPMDQVKFIFILMFKFHVLSFILMFELVEVL